MTFRHKFTNVHKSLYQTKIDFTLSFLTRNKTQDQIKLHKRFFIRRYINDAFNDVIIDVINEQRFCNWRLKPSENEEDESEDEDNAGVRDHGREAQQRFGLLRRSAFAHLRVRAQRVVAQSQGCHLAIVCLRIFAHWRKKNLSKIWNNLLNL